MKFTSQAQRALAELPLAGVNVLVDAQAQGEEDAAVIIKMTRDLVGTAGTIVSAAFTDTWTLLDVAATPQPFHPDLQVSPSLGPVAELFRRQPGVLRSGHPSHSFAACGPQAHEMLSTNRDNNPLGPVKKLNVMNGFALTIGVSPRACTALHLAEQLALPKSSYRGTAKRINLAGYEERVVVDHIAMCTDGYDSLEDQILPEAIHGADVDGLSIHLYPLRALIRRASAAIAAEPHSILCARSECASCAIRMAAIATEARTADG